MQVLIVLSIYMIPLVGPGWRNGRRMHALIDTRNEVAFPGQAMNLPVTKGDEAAEQTQREDSEQRQSQRSSRTAHNVFGGSIGWRHDWE